MADSQNPEEGDITVVTREIPTPPESRAIEKHGTLTVLIGPNVGAAFALSSPAVLLGRNPRAHVTIEDDGVSRNHARILHRGHSYELEDMGSTNGTYVDGERVRGHVQLQNGARVQIGNTLLRFALQDDIELEAAKRVYEASVRDSLTGAFNRRYFEEHLIREFGYAARHGTALCVLLLDLDNFKQVNDRFGHLAGDQVLRKVGAALRGTMRVEDMIARYGGEEFAVLTRGIGVAGTRSFADRLRVLVERTVIPWEGQNIPMTVSVGMAHNHSGAAATDPQRLVAAADQALYAAKHSGRNRVELALSPGRYKVVGDAEPPATEPPKPRRWDNTTEPSDQPKPGAELLPGAAIRPPKGPKS